MASSLETVDTHLQVGDPPADLAEGELFCDALHGEVRRRRRLRDGAATAAAKKVANGGLLGSVDVVVVVLIVVLLLEGSMRVCVHIQGIPRYSICSQTLVWLTLILAVQLRVASIRRLYYDGTFVLM